MKHARPGRVALVLALALQMPLPATAHHSNAMFDAARTVTLSGRLKEFQWTNPHCWIQLLVTGSSGTAEEWSIQMGPPSNLYRDGWRPHALKGGDALTIQIHPMKDGSRGGIWVSGTHADGTPIGSASPTK